MEKKEAAAAEVSGKKNPIDGEEIGCDSWKGIYLIKSNS